MKKEKTPKLLNDKIANIIFTCKECRLFVELVISKALDIDLELIKDKLDLQTVRINNNVNSKYSMVDSIYDFNEGHESRNIEIAKLMLKDNVDFNTIQKYTGLSLEEIEELKNR